MSNVALLAPVPLEHLEGGAGVCQAMGKVAFGSRAWEVFRELDELRNGNSVAALLYASDAYMDGPPSVTWRGQYIGYVDGKNGAHPEGMRFRPASTSKYDSDYKGWWAVFWEVSGLERLPTSGQIPIRELQSRSGSYYKPAFVPEGPIIIAAP